MKTGLGLQNVIVGGPELQHSVLGLYQLGMVENTHHQPTQSFIRMVFSSCCWMLIKENLKPASIGVR